MTREEVFQEELRRNQSFARMTREDAPKAERDKAKAIIRGIKRHPWILLPRSFDNLVGRYGSIKDLSRVRSSAVRAAVLEAPGDAHVYVGRTWGVRYYGPGDGTDYEPWDDLEFEFAVWGTGRAVVEEVVWSRAREFTGAITVGMAVVLWLGAEGLLLPSDVEAARSAAATSLAIYKERRRRSKRQVDGPFHVLDWPEPDDPEDDLTDEGDEPDDPDGPADGPEAADA